MVPLLSTTIIKGTLTMPFYSQCTLAILKKGCVLWNNKKKKFKKKVLSVMETIRKIKLSWHIFRPIQKHIRLDRKLTM